MNSKKIAIISVILGIICIMGYLVLSYLDNSKEGGVKIVDYDKNKIEDIDKKVSENKKEIKNRYSCPEVNEIRDFSGMDCITTSIVNKQVELRTIQQLKETHEVNYDIQDVINHYQKMANESKNKLRSKIDVGSSLGTWIEMLGVETYSKDHEMEYLSEIIIEKEKQNIINSMSDQEKQNVIKEGSALWVSMGLKEDEAERKAIDDYASNIAGENFFSEVESVKYQKLIDIFKEVQPDLYNKLPNEQMKDNYIPDVEIPQQ